MNAVCGNNSCGRSNAFAMESYKNANAGQQNCKQLIGLLKTLLNALII
jgi:hypothetical protein